MGAIFDKEYINEWQAIHEISHASTEQAIASQLVRFYQHCIKWVHQPSKQYPRWIDTIFSASRDLKKMYDKNNKFINMEIDFYGCYKKGLEKAEGETHIKPIEDYNYVYDCFKDFNYSNEYGKEVIGIFNEQGIKDFLLLHAYDDNVRKLVENKK